MATETGPDLTAARDAIESLMDDECVITVDVEGADDDTLNQQTMALEPPPGDTVTLYTGRCKVGPVGGGGLSGGERTVEEGGAFIERRAYTLSLPVASPEIPKGALVRITSSRRDPLLVGKEFRAIQPVYGTFIISRKVSVELRT